MFAEDESPFADMRLTNDHIGVGCDQCDGEGDINY